MSKHTATLLVGTPGQMKEYLRLKRQPRELVDDPVSVLDIFPVVQKEGKDHFKIKGCLILVHKEDPNLSEEEIIQRVKAANAAGFMNQMIAGSGATAEQASVLYKKSNEKADKLIKKAELIRESILAEAKGVNSPEVANLPDNLKAAAQS